MPDRVEDIPLGFEHLDQWVDIRIKALSNSDVESARLVGTLESFLINHEIEQISISMKGVQRATVVSLRSHYISSVFLKRKPARL